MIKNRRLTALSFLVPLVMMLTELAAAIKNQRIKNSSIKVHTTPRIMCIKIQKAGFFVLTMALIIQLTFGNFLGIWQTDFINKHLKVAKFDLVFDNSAQK